MFWVRPDLPTPLDVLGVPPHGWILMRNQKHLNELLSERRVPWFYWLYLSGSPVPDWSPATVISLFSSSDGGHIERWGLECTSTALSRALERTDWCNIGVAWCCRVMSDSVDLTVLLALTYKQHAEIFELLRGSSSSILALLPLLFNCVTHFVPPLMIIKGNTDRVDTVIRIHQQEVMCRGKKKWGGARQEERKEEKHILWKSEAAGQTGGQTAD